MIKFLLFFFTVSLVYSQETLSENVYSYEVSEEQNTPQNNEEQDTTVNEVQSYEAPEVLNITMNKTQISYGYEVSEEATSGSEQVYDYEEALYNAYTEGEILSTDTVALTWEDLADEEPYIPPYKIDNPNAYKTPKLPKLYSSDGLLKNLDKTYWFLKFHSHPDASLFSALTLGIKDSALDLKIYDYNDEVVENHSYRLMPVQMKNPNEGIFAYQDKKGQLYFVYLRLILPYLLAMEMTTSFEEAEASGEKSLDQLGVFVLS